MAIDALTLLAPPRLRRLLGFFVYKELSVRDLERVILDSALSTAAIAIIISAAQPFGWARWAFRSSRARCGPS